MLYHTLPLHTAINGVYYVVLLCANCLASEKTRTAGTWHHFPPGLWSTLSSWWCVKLAACLQLGGASTPSLFLDVSPCDCIMFAWVKEPFNGGCWFESSETIYKAVTTLLHHLRTITTLWLSASSVGEVCQPWCWLRWVGDRCKYVVILFLLIFCVCSMYWLHTGHFWNSSCMQGGDF